MSFRLEANDDENKAYFLKLLKQLIQVPGVTGYEDMIRDTISAMLKPTGANLSSDHLGNLYASLPGGDGTTPKIMVCAHMDEVGYVVNAIDDHGFIYLYPLGGLPDYLGPGEWVCLHAQDEEVHGTIGIHPPHLTVAGQREIFVDIGAASRAEVLQRGVTIGTPVTYNRELLSLNEARVMARCLDDRMGCAVLIALLEHLVNSGSDLNVTCVFTSTEEHGMPPGNSPGPVSGSRGALVAALKLRPHFAVVVDSMAGSDIPGIPAHLRQIHLGGGPALRLVDDLAIMPPGMRAFLQDIAARHGINIQEGISRSYTDTSMIQLADVPVATLGIPLRYAHSPGQVADLNDLLQTLRFTNAIINNISQYLSA